MHTLTGKRLLLIVVRQLLSGKGFHLLVLQRCAKLNTGENLNACLGTSLRCGNRKPGFVV
jgi:hypothetical protein